MGIVAKLIFNHIASGKGVNLPSVGSLSVKHQGAEFVSKSEVKPPYNKVEFSTEQKKDYDSVVTLIVNSEGVKRPEATKIYKAWLAKATSKDGVVEIIDTGVLKDGVFYPSVKLSDILNPSGNDVIVIKNKKSPWRWIIIILLILVALLTAAYFACPYCCGDSCSDSDSIECVTSEDTNQAEPDVITADQIDSEIKDMEALPVAVNKGNEIQYHVVVGAFVEPSNADNYIKQDLLLIGQSSYKKMSYKDKTLVVAYSSTDRSKALRKSRELRDFDRGIWVYIER